jgi:hypothetical protein
MRRLILALAIASSVSACTHPVGRVVLPLPPAPVLPKVAGADLACLSDDAYKRLDLRDRLWENYARSLEEIIRATQ